MTWLRDETKLARVQSLLAEQDLDALVVRAPDNIVYLTNYWCMKGFDAAVFPREGEPTLLVMKPQEDNGAEDRLDGRRPALRRLRPGRPAGADRACARPRRCDPA